MADDINPDSTEPADASVTQPPRRLNLRGHIVVDDEPPIVFEAPADPPPPAASATADAQAPQN